MNTTYNLSLGVTGQSLIAPEVIYLNQSLMDCLGNVEMQLDLILDYKNNVNLYPGFQACFRKYKPELLIICSKHDPCFSVAGAESFKKDDPNTVIKIYNTGHFALETNAKDTGRDVYSFLSAL